MHYNENNNTNNLFKRTRNFEISSKNNSNPQKKISFEKSMKKPKNFKKKKVLRSHDRKISVANRWIFTLQSDCLYFFHPKTPLENLLEKPVTLLPSQTANKIKDLDFVVYIFSFERVLIIWPEK